MIVEHGNVRPALKAGPIGKFQRHVLVIVENRDVDGRLGGGHAIFSIRIQSLQCWLRKLGGLSPPERAWHRPAGTRQARTHITPMLKDTSLIGSLSPHLKPWI